MVMKQTRAAWTGWAGIVTCAEGGGQQQVRRTSDTQTQTAQQPGQLTQYRCLYRTARLLYSATLVTAPGT